MLSSVEIAGRLNKISSVTPDLLKRNENGSMTGFLLISMAKQRVLITML